MTQDPSIDSVPVDPDLFGRICADYLKAGSADFLIERDDGFDDPSTPEEYFRTELSPEEARALAHASGHVLDIGCGPGADLLYLQNRGFRVTGIDLSPGCIDLARRRGAQDARVHSLWDIPNLPILFDTVLMMSNGMGLPGSVEKTGDFLDLLRDCTNDNAVLIAHSVDPVASANDRHRAYHRRNEAQGRYKGELRIRRKYKGAVSSWWGLVLFEKPVLGELIKAHHWKEIETIDSGPTYFLIARKEK
jgi:SAM-dependent methyltransferase